MGEMPTMGVRPRLGHFKQALMACQRATRRGPLIGEGPEGVPKGWEAEAEREAGVEERAEAAVAAVPEIFRLMREMEVTPDDECYALAMM